MHDDVSSLLCVYENASFPHVYCPSNTFFKTESQLGLYLSVLLQVVVQYLRMSLLVWCQDVHEGGRGVASSSRWVDWSPTPQGRGQAK